MSARAQVTARALALCLGLLLAAAPALAHHGWGWTEGDNTELTGTITSARLVNPHGRLTLDVDGEEWLVEVGQPWRNQRAGLTDEMLSEGRTITVVGERSADPDERRLKAERVYIDGKEHALYPHRD